MIEKTKERISFEKIDRSSVVFTDTYVTFKCFLGVNYKYNFIDNEFYSNYRASAKSKKGTVVYTQDKYIKRSVYKGKTDYTGGYYLSASFLGRNNRFHRLIMYLVYGDDLFLKEVDHIDGNRENNNPNNLRLCSREENAKHASNRGAFYAKNIYSGKLQEKDILEIKKLLYSGIKQQDIADIYGVDTSNISRINTNTWKSIKYIKEI